MLLDILIVLSCIIFGPMALLLVAIAVVVWVFVLWLVYTTACDLVKSTRKQVKKG